MVKRSATAVWNGNLKEGNGRLASERGALKDTPYSFSGRFGESTAGTNPEELIAAAHAGCFSMALSGELGKLNLTPDRIETTATLTMEKVDEKMTITRMHLQTVAMVPNATPETFKQAADAAKAGCPVSRLLKNLEITLDAKLE